MCNLIYLLYFFSVVTIAHPLHALFSEFQTKYNKLYKTREEFNYRFEVFVQNHRIIQEHNANSTNSFRLGINKFADLTNYEFKQLRRGYDTSVLERSGKNFHTFEGQLRGSLPSAIDWVQRGKVTRVKDQEWCGGCWAFAVADATESRYAIKHNTMPVELSVQEQLDCNHNGVNQGCVGGNLPEGYDYIIDHRGLCLASDYKYEGDDNRKKCAKRSRYCRRKSGQITDYGIVVPNNEKALKVAVSLGPVSIAIEADDERMQLYESGVFSSNNCGTNVDHAMTIVGYGVERRYGNLEYWKIKGTWGDSWGEDGYIRVCRNCGKNGRTGECGVTVEAVFPIV